jgi:5-carboxymethyl-2-hydroxymuconate isomerase
MPHCVVEYTTHIKHEARIPELLRKVNQTLIAQGPTYQPGAIRSRAVELTDSCIADGAADDAFVHVTLKIAGRPADVKQRTGDAIFDMMKAHFAELYERRSLALSLELYEFPEPGTWKHSNLHAHVAARTPRT